MVSENNLAQRTAADLVKQAVQVRRKRVQTEADVRKAMLKFDAEFAKLLGRLQRLASGGDSDTFIDPTNWSGLMRTVAELAEEEASVLERCDQELAAVQRWQHEIAQMLSDKTCGPK